MSDFLTQAESLFHEVRALGRDAQVQRLDRIGPQDPMLRATIEALLRADNTPDERLDRPIRDVVFGEICATGLLHSETEARVRQIAAPMRPSERYHDRREIGRGGMATVYRVHDATLDRDLAMKVIGGGSTLPARPEGAMPGQVLRFLREARVLARLDHPGIVPIHDLGVDEDGRPFFTMKLVQGNGASSDQLGERRTLEDVLELTKAGTPGWSPTRVLEILLRVCEALAYAHTRGVRHRDLKPSNVMVGQFGEVYVMDWGLAHIQGDPTSAAPTSAAPGGPPPEPRPAREGVSALTVTGDLLGTPEYMASEQAQGVEIDQRADIYSVGAILYRALTGVPPYQDGTAANKRRAAYQVLARLCQGPPRPVLEIAPKSSAELVAICERAMERDRERRYADVEQLAGDLRAFLEGRVVHAYEMGAWAEARKWVQRNKPLAAALAAAVVLLVIGLVTSLVFKARADEQARLTKERADDVLRLSGLQELDDLLAESDRLWPVHPDLIARYEAWIARARGLASDLPQHRAQRAKLRSLALPRTEEQRQAERESHPEHSRLARLKKEIASKRAALSQRRDGVAAEPPKVDWNQLPSNANDLNSLAWPKVDPDRQGFGEEALGLAMARKAVDLAASDGERSMFGVTLAWACFALGRDDEALEASRAALETAAEERKTEFEGYLSKVEEAVASAASKEGLQAAFGELGRLESEHDRLETRVDERRDWRFPEEHAEARWWNAQLTKLIEGLVALEAGLLVEDGSVEHGWSVPKRLAFALDLKEGFAEGGQFERKWAQAIPAIRERYVGLALKPHVGLIPIGPDPKSGLWEFAHLMSGKPAEKGLEGKLFLTEETGIVLVLLPGGIFWMGAQKSDPSGRNYDPQAEDDEQPPRQVELSPFFLSKYEMTQAQWERLTGGNPSAYQPQENSGVGVYNLLHPVEQLKWEDCMARLPRAGLTLPSEAQWEYGARAETDTPWWTGSERKSLLDGDAGNLADRSAVDAGAPWPEAAELPELDDGYLVHAPIGSYMANGFGIHDVVGNVWELCLDSYRDHPYISLAELHDPVFSQAGTDVVKRGGCFTTGALAARSSNRDVYSPSAAHFENGLRPAMSLSSP